MKKWFPGKNREPYEALVASAENRMTECTCCADAAGWRELAGQMVKEGVRCNALSAQQGEIMLRRLDCHMETVRRRLALFEKEANHR